MDDVVLDGQVVDETPVQFTPKTLPSGHLLLIESLRAMADFYERRPEVPVPNITSFNVWPVEADLPRIARAIGKCEKTTLSDAYFILRKDFGAFALDFNWSRQQVCERVVVGRETIEEKVPVHTTYETRMVERDRVEWHCPKSIIARPQIEAPAAPVAPPAAASDEDIPF